MVEKITRGIKISVKTKFKGVIIKTYKFCFEFVSTINIRNTSNDAVQILSQYWQISDALNSTEICERKGIMNGKPVIKPGEVHTYDSVDLIDSPFGTIRGHLDMIIFSSTKTFRAEIPEFKLCAPFALN